MTSKIVAKSLVQSLVGCSIEFRDSKNTSKLDSGPALNLLRKKITNFCLRANQSDSSLALLCLTCCQLYYLRQSNYFSIRSSLILGRYREGVMICINKGTDSIEETICCLLKFEARFDKSSKRSLDHRDLLIDAIKYFISLYPSRLKNIKSFLTKDEIAYVL